jgi:hypothetical protein
MRAIRGLMLVLGLLASGGVAAAGVGGGLRASHSPGVGLEVLSGVLEPFGRRAWITAMRDDVEEAGIRYDDSFRYGTGFLLADWHPGGTGFAFQAGWPTTSLNRSHGSPERRDVGIGSSYPQSCRLSKTGCAMRAEPVSRPPAGACADRKSLYFSATGVMYQRPASFIGSCTGLTPGACGPSTCTTKRTTATAAKIRFHPVVSGVGLRFLDRSLRCARACRGALDRRGAGGGRSRPRRVADQRKAAGRSDFSSCAHRQRCHRRASARDTGAGARQSLNAASTDSGAGDAVSSILTSFCRSSPHQHRTSAPVSLHGD